MSAPHKAFSTPPPTRWRVPPESSLPNHFGFIDDDVLTGFPFARYGLPRAEAETLDPTHRLILQLVWEALENARLDPSTLGGPRTGVYLGLGSTDWSHQALGPHAIVSAHAGTGAWSSVAAGRIAYTLGITGPTLCVDTACSSGLVAAHLALRDLRSGTIDRAIVASANLLLDPSSTTTLMTLGALSPSGRCRPFDREADGYVRSEGGVALVLENQNVHTQRTRVHGWIAGSAINHDGPSNGLTAPSARAQQAVLLAALKEADWPASSLDLMEAHGTGTPLGDPIEWQALREVYGSGDRPCRVGTLKGTHGHLEAASGLAGLLRILATFRHGRTFPQPWLEEVNPLVSLEGTRLSIPSQSVDGPYLKAGVSAFGLSGTNAHLLVQAPSTSETEVLPQPDTPGDSVVIGLSGPTREAVVDLARHWEQHATACSPKELCGIAQTRAQERFRIAGVVSPGQSPSEVIALCAQGPIDPSNPRVRIGFAYTGQGAQLVNMALPLMAQEPIFQAAMEEVGAVYGQLSGHSLHDILKDEKALNHTSFTQPALFAVEWSLTQLFAAWHLKPDLVLGHSVGEIAAACTAGVFTMEDAMALAVARGRVLGDLPEGGSMAAIEAQPQELLPTLPDDVVIAGFNGPRNTTISGNSSSVQQVVEHWARDHRMAHLLTVSHAFHSPRMASASEGLRTALSTCDMRPPELPWFSTLTGKAATQTSASAAYWSEQLVRPVRFQEAVESAQEHVDIFVELGPRPVLSGLAHGFSSCPWLGTLHASRDEVLALRETLARLWSLGAPVDRTSWGPSGTPVDLPVMPVRAGSLPLHPKPTTALSHKRTSYLALKWSRAVSLPRATGSWIDREDPTCRRLLKEAGLMDDQKPQNLLVKPTGTGPEQCLQVQSALALAQKEGLRLWVLTTGMRQAEPSAHAFAVWGLAACMEMEHPRSWGGILDVDPDAASQIGDVLGRAPRARLRTSGLLVPRLTELDDLTPKPLAPIRSALVLGGTGSIGQAIVRWLHEQGVPEIHVASRDPSRASMLPPNTQAHSCDLQDDHALGKLLTDLQDTHPLDVVFHAAGQAHRSSTLETPHQTWADAWFGRMKSLDTLKDDLDPTTRVVALGSVAAIWGGERLAPYAAACGGLDGSVRAAQQQGLGWSLLTLGPWAGGGMIPVQELDDMRQSGQAFVQTSDLHQALHKVLTEPQCLTLCPADWSQLGRLLQTRRTRPFLSEITPPPPRPARVIPPIRTVLEKTVVSLLGRLPEPTEGFFDAGFDSLLAVELARRLEATLGRTIPVACVFDHPSIESLSTFLNRSVETTSPPKKSQDPARVDDPVVICAIACRFPGADNPDQFAEQLERGHSLITGVPSDRFVDGRRTGGFVKDIDLFDPDAFGLAPREALAIDPQQRMLLETARQVLDQAGPASTHPTVTGVYIGIGHSEYWRRLQHHDEPGASHPSYPWSGTGNASSFAAGRLAHAFGLEGPTLTIDTACSSSLVALHLAMRALRTGECDAALVGGTNALLERESFMYLDSLGALSPSGVCRAFDARADGYVRGEGCGMILVTRRSRAEQLSWPILAQLLGSATGHDGHASGLTVPNGSAQERVIRDALADAGCHPDEVDYVETHGTGTALGDPIELAALSRVHAHRSRPLKIGSLKPSIGHLEAASGVASVIKVVMALNRGRLPATIEHEHPTEHWPEGFDARVVTTLQPWERTCIAGVSSFGLSGTNAHVVLSGPPVPEEVPTRDSQVAFLAASEKTPERLDRWWEAWSACGLEPIEQATGLARHPDQTFRRVQVGDRVAEGQVTTRPSVGVLMNLSSELELPGPCSVPAPSGMAESFAIWARHQPHLKFDAQPKNPGQRKEVAAALGLATLKQLLDWGIPIDAVRWVDPPDLLATLWETSASFASMPAPNGPSKPTWRDMSGEEISAPDVVIDLSLGPQTGDANTISALRGDAPWVEQLMWCVGELWVRGVPVDRDRIHRPRPLVGAPPRPFVRHRLWADASSALPQGWRRVWRPHEDGAVTSTLQTQVCVLDTHLSGPELIHEALRHVRDSSKALTWVWTHDGEGLEDAPGCDALALIATLSTLQVEEPERPIRLWLGSLDSLQTVPAGNEDVVWMRAGVPHTPVLETIPSTPEPAFPLTGHWLVTGGLGALGQHVVSWLQRAGIRVTTVGRTGAPDSDGTASHATVDVSDMTAFEQWIQTHGPFDGAVHCAGTSSQTLARQITLTDLQQAYGAKVGGARVLDANMDGPLILFGSATAWFGLPGQAGYAAANATVEGIMHERHQRRLPGKCIVWGPWTEGMASELKREPGTQFMAPKRAIQALSQSLDGLPSTAIFDLQPHRFIERYARVPTWLRSWSHGPRTSQDALALSVAEARALVAQVASQVLGQTQPLSIQQGFADAGMDSIMAVELSRRLSTHLGRPLSLTVAFDHPRVDKLAAHIAQAKPVSNATTPSQVHSEEEPIAIVGMALRLPGANDVDELWQNLVNQHVSVDTVPSSRWGLSGVEPAARYGAFLEDIDLFDPSAFGIAPREAASMDPQQRLLLEVAWEALHRGGHAPSLEGSRTGTFVGIADRGYLRRFDAAGSSRYADAWAGTGNEPSFAAGRIAHALGLTGPALSLNTTCSSSLVAIDLARRALLDGTCDQAIAGGVHLMLTPDESSYLSQLGALSPSGRCRSFDARADGYVRAEGCGVIVMKRWSDARRDGDPVHALILSSATNHDGRSSGLTVPNGEAQRQVIHSAWKNISEERGTLGLLQAHGTGTPLGDPIEYRAAQEALSARCDGPVLVRSIKANIGHSELAAGIAGLIDAVMCLERESIPAIPDLTSPNPHLPQGALTLAQSQTPWPRGDSPRLAGVSAFGLSGTNAHLVLAEAPLASGRRSPVPPPALERTRFWLEGDRFQSPQRVHHVAWSPTDLGAPYDGALVVVSEDEPHPLALQMEVETIHPDHVGQWLAEQTGEAGLLLAQPSTSQALHAHTFEWMKAAQVAAARPQTRLWFITQHGAAVGDETTSPTGCLFGALARALTVEFPDLCGAWCDTTTWGLIDRRCLLNSRHVARRIDGTWTPTLQPSKCSEHPAPLPDTWVITGGLGALGLHTARGCVARGATELHLVGRTALDHPSREKAREDIAALIDQGCAVHTHAVDVTDQPAMMAMFASLSSRPIGVVHAAGITEPTPTSQASIDHVERVLRPKLEGANVLEACIQTVEVTHLICFGSIASVWGSRDLAAYAAANGWLAGWARQLQSETLTARCIQWGPWAGGGMIGQEEAQQLSLYGLKPLDAQSALDALAQTLQQHHPAPVVVDAEWNTLHAHLAHTPSGALFEPLLAPEPAPYATGLQASGPGTTPPPIHDPVAAREIILKEAQAILRLRAPLSPEIPLMELGLDSLMATELRNVLAERGLVIPLGRLLGGPSVDEMVTIALALQSQPASHHDARNALDEDVPHWMLWTHLAALVLGAALATGVAVLLQRLNG